MSLIWMMTQAAAAEVRSDEDGPLVALARQGDMHAFGVLVDKYQHRVVNLAQVLVSRRDEAEDVAQEVFLRVYRGLKDFRGGSLFRTWLYRIATNAARSHLAQRRSRREEPAEEDQFARVPAPEDLERAIVDRDRLDRALAAVPLEFREALILRDIEGLDYREIGAALNLPIGTVESRIFRGRQRLRATLLGQETDHDT